MIWKEWVQMVEWLRTIPRIDRKITSLIEWSVLLFLFFYFGGPHVLAQAFLTVKRNGL